MGHLGGHHSTIPLLHRDVVRRRDVGHASGRRAEPQDEPFPITAQGSPFPVHGADMSHGAPRFLGEAGMGT
jgi:hypothetical protein